MGLVNRVNFNWFLGIVFAIGLILSTTAFRDKATDFRAYYLPGQRLAAKILAINFVDKQGVAYRKKITPRDSLYNKGEATPFKYTPTAAYLFLPLTLFSYKTAKVIWYFFALLSLIGSFIFIKKQWFRANHNYTSKGLFLTFMATYLLLARFYLYDIKNLQVNFFILLCFTYFLFNYKKSVWSAAFFLAFAISFKILPVIILLFFIVERDWKLLSTVITVGLLLIFFPAIQYGGGDKLYSEYMRYFDFMLEGHQFPASSSYIHSSIDTLIVRLLMDRPVFTGLKINFMSLSASTTSSIIISVKVLLLLVVGYYQFITSKMYKKVGESAKSFFFWGMFSVYVTLSQLIGPLTWKHAYVINTLLVFLIIYKLIYLFPKEGKIYWRFFILSQILLVLSSKGFTFGLHKYVAAFGPITIGTIILIVIELMLLHKFGERLSKRECDK